MNLWVIANLDPNNLYLICNAELPRSFLYIYSPEVSVTLFKKKKKVCLLFSSKIKLQKLLKEFVGS